MTPDLPLKQKVFAIIAALLFLALIFNLVRRRRLQIEYSWLWIATGLSMIVLIWRYDWLVLLTTAIGAVTSTTTLFLLAIFFLAVVNLHYSVRISEMSTRIKDLAQETALLQHDLAKLKAGGKPPEG